MNCHKWGVRKRKTRGLGKERKLAETALGKGVKKKKKKKKKKGNLMDRSHDGTAEKRKMSLPKKNKGVRGEKKAETRWA